MRGNKRSLKSEYSRMSSLISEEATGLSVSRSSMHPNTWTFEKYSQLKQKGRLLPWRAGRRERNFARGLWTDLISSRLKATLLFVTMALEPCVPPSCSVVATGAQAEYSNSRAELKFEPQRLCPDDKKHKIGRDRKR